MLRIVVLSLFVTFACAATWRGFLPPKPEEFADKEGCYVKEINDVIPFGSQIAPIGHCVRIECGGDMIHYASCGVVMTDDPKCHKTDVDLSRPYPDCCPNIKCDEDNNL